MTRALSGFALALAICAATPFTANADDAARCTWLAEQCTPFFAQRTQATFVFAGIIFYLQKQ